MSSDMGRIFTVLGLRVDSPSKVSNVALRDAQCMKNETRSCSMDFGGITPQYVYRMWNGSVALEDIEKAMAEIKFPGQ